MGDGVFVTRFLFVLMVAWPPLATAIVFGLGGSPIRPAWRRVLASVVSGYALSLLVPLSLAFGSMALGAIAEEAALYMIVLSIPLLLVLVPGAALFWSRRADAEVSR